jgi:hypothetical protein
MRNPFQSLRAAVVIVGGLVLAMSCTAPQKPEAKPSEKETLTKDQRLDAIARATIWAPTDVASMDIRQGPTGKGALEPFANITCTYVQKVMDGTSRKFTCELPATSDKESTDSAAKGEKAAKADAVKTDAPQNEATKDQKAEKKEEKGDQVKIKYGQANPEVPGVVASSRLLWALGYGADRWYPVHVVCHGCTTDPWYHREVADGDSTFEFAALERPVSGKTIETKADEGWAWPEIDETDPARGGATMAQADALKLLAVFLQHSDSKGPQQKLVCVEGTVLDCKAPFMFVHDVGLTFGHATLMNVNSQTGINYANWVKTPVWRGQTGCVGNIEKSWSGTLDEPRISEEGRAFLADLLAKLTDKQITDLFEVARIPEFSHVTVDQWVSTFKAKRQEITSRSCAH